MKKILALLFIFFTLTGCKTAESTITDIRDLPMDYGIYSEKETAIADGVVVITSKETYNTNKLDSFLKHAAKGKKAFVRTIAYTTEGDPIITDFEYDGEKYIRTYDNRRDSFSGSGSITTTYWPYLISNDRGEMYLSSWSSFYGDNVEVQPVRTHSYQLCHASDELIQLLRAKYSGLTGQFISPDGEHHITLTPDSSVFTVSANGSDTELTMPDGPAPICVLWQDEKNALLAGEQDGVMLYLSVDTETGEVGNWEEMTFSEYDELREEADFITRHASKRFGPGSKTYQITEPLSVSNGGSIVSLQYRTVVRFNYIHHEPAVDLILYFDWFTGEYLGQTGYIGQKRTVSDPEDKAFSIMCMDLDKYNLSVNTESLTLTATNPYNTELLLKGWNIHRFRNGYWHMLDGVNDVLLTELSSGNSFELQTELPLMDTGYYRIGLYFNRDNESYVSYCYFTVGSVTDFETYDLPKSDRTVVNDRGVGITLLRNAVPDDEIILYAVEADKESDEFHTGCGAYLEVLIDGTWCILPDRISGFDAVGMTIGGDEREIYESLTITDYLLPLEEGHYRILKQGYFENCHDVYIAGEFDVVDGRISDYEVSAPDGLVFEALCASDPNPKGDAKQLGILTGLRPSG